jgi:hypothetical protein
MAAAFRTVLTNPAYHFKRIGLEVGPLSQWLFSALAEAGLPVICVETRHMRAVQPVWNEEDCGEGNGPLSSRPRARVNECPNWTPWEERR